MKGAFTRSPEPTGRTAVSAPRAGSALTGRMLRRGEFRPQDFER